MAIKMDVRGAVELIVDPDDVVTVGGPGLNEVEMLAPLLRELSDLDGDKYNAMIVVYKRGASIADAQEFRDKLIAAKKFELVGKVADND